MITLTDVSFFAQKNGQPEVFFSDMSAHFGAMERVGILGPSGSGKTALARLITGMLPPNSGQILHEGKVSPPMGFSAPIHGEMTVAQNIELLAQATADDADEILLLCATLGGLEKNLNTPFKELSNKEKRVVSFCLSLGSINDYYVADDGLVFGDPDQQAAGLELLEERLNSAGLIVISSNANQMKRLCNRFLVIRDEQLIPCDDIDAVGKELKSGPLSKDRQTKSGPLNVE